MTHNILLAGFGGQGILFCGKVSAYGGLMAGKQVSWLPSYGPEMRGGTANCTVKYSENTIYNPSQEQPDLLLAMNSPSFHKFLPLVAPGGVVVIGDLVEIPEDARKDVTYVRVPATRISTELNNPKGANIVMTGAIVKLMGDFTKEAAIAAMIHMFEKKGKSRFNEANEKAFNAGYDAVETLALDSCVR